MVSTVSHVRCVLQPLNPSVASGVLAGGHAEIGTLDAAASLVIPK